MAPSRLHTRCIYGLARSPIAKVQGEALAEYSVTGRLHCWLEYCGTGASENLKAAAKCVSRYTRIHQTQDEKQAEEKSSVSRGTRKSFFPFSFLVIFY